MYELVFNKTAKGKNLFHRKKLGREIFSGTTIYDLPHHNNNRRHDLPSGSWRHTFDTVKVSTGTTFYACHRYEYVLLCTGPKTRYKCTLEKIPSNRQSTVAPPTTSNQFHPQQHRCCCQKYSYQIRNCSLSNGNVSKRPIEWWDSGYCTYSSIKRHCSL